MRLRSGPPLRVLGFDLENRPGAYWFGDATTSQITAFAWKWVGEPVVHTMLLRADGRFERDQGRPVAAKVAYQRFVGELAAAGLVFGHNIRQHDLPMLNAGLLRLHLPPLPPVLTTDTLRDYPKRRGMAANLASFADLYDLGGEKHAMSQHAWEQANQLTREGVAEARERVVSDVLLQETLRGRLLELGVLKPPRTWTA